MLGLVGQTISCHSDCEITGEGRAAAVQFDFKMCLCQCPMLPGIVSLVTGPGHPMVTWMGHSS